MTATTSAEYYQVYENSIERKQFNFGNFIDSLCNYFEDFDDINFGKFRVPVALVSSVDEFLVDSVSRLGSYECIKLSPSFFLFAVRSLFFHVTWSVVDGVYVFAILHGTRYYCDEDEVYVFHYGDDDADTIVGSG